MKKLSLLLFAAIFIFFSCSHEDPADNRTESHTVTTSFPAAENPISENGQWANGGALALDWHNVVTTPGLAMGTDSPAPYSDPVAILTGTWHPDQIVEATVYSINQTETYEQGVELRLRNTITAHSITGYEILFRCLKTASAYVAVIKWNGPLADFVYLDIKYGAQYGVTTGDIVKASIIGNKIEVYINNVLVTSGVDNSFATGNPGLGFNFGCGGTYSDFGFSKFKATDLVPLNR
jgi:hypothetical protein